MIPSNTTTIRATNRNLGTYSNVSEGELTHRLLAETAAMNFVDKAAYPSLARMEEATARFLLGLTHGPQGGFGIATTGSSEAIILALAWHQRNFVAQHPNAHRPNFVVSQAHHKSFEKYAVLFGAELRPVKLNKKLGVDVASMESLIDENTFCIVGIAGSTELGMLDDIVAIDRIAQRHNLPVHIDAAAGGYILPFLKNKGSWDFALSTVQTMNISAHKYGLCLPGIGYLLARDMGLLPANYSGQIAYLSGGGSVDYALSCSRNGAFVAQAYQNTLRYGYQGYEAIAHHNTANALYLAESLRSIKGITHVVLGDTPVVNVAAINTPALSDHLSRKGWIQSPHVICPLGQSYIRIVIRHHITQEVIDELLNDIRTFCAR